MKQEILEEVAQKLYPIKDINWTLKPQQDAFIKGAKWQQERMYSEEDMKQAFNVGRLYLGREGDTNFEQFIEQFKNK